VQWWQIGRLASGAAVAMMAYMIALEALLSPQDGGEGVTRVVSERAALILSDLTAEERLAMNREVNGLYNVRSRIAHGQRLLLAWNDQSWGDVQHLSAIARRVGTAFLEQAQDSWQTEEQIAAWFDRRRFSVKS
jgi:hypothetical protein